MSAAKVIYAAVNNVNDILFKKNPQKPPIMLALCSMLWHTYYAQNYAGIIGPGLVA